MDHRIGLIALDSDATTEPDFCRMLPPGVVFYTTRIRHINPVSVENLRKQGPQLAEAAALLIPGQPLDVIAYSCTSATAALGFTEVAEQIRAGGRADVPVVTPLTAALAAFELLRVRSISLLTPHPDEVNRSSVEFFESNGIEVVNVETFDMDDVHLLYRIAGGRDCRKSGKRVGKTGFNRGPVFVLGGIAPVWS